jgi:hypothetical protein
MVDDPQEIILEHLRGIRADIRDLKAGQNEIKAEIQAVRGRHRAIEVERDALQPLSASAPASARLSVATSGRRRSPSTLFTSGTRKRSRNSPGTPPTVAPSDPPCAGSASLQKSNPPRGPAPSVPRTMTELTGPRPRTTLS